MPFHAPSISSPEPQSTVSSTHSERSCSPSQHPGFREPVHIIPALPKQRSAKAYEQVVRDWEFADPARSLYVPMKDWKPEWHKASKLTQKYGQRQMVAVEFIDQWVFESISCCIYGLLSFLQVTTVIKHGSKKSILSTKGVLLPSWRPSDVHSKKEGIAKSVWHDANAVFRFYSRVLSSMFHILPILYTHTYCT